jgi:hypothetical protein
MSKEVEVKLDLALLHFTKLSLISWKVDSVVFQLSGRVFLCLEGIHSTGRSIKDRKARWQIHDRGENNVQDTKL